MLTSFHANGKLLLSGEYFVLDGAKAIGLPCQFGQQLNVSTKTDSGLIYWTSKTVEGNTWYRGVFYKEDLSIVESSDQEVSLVLQNILRQARYLNSTFLSSKESLSIETVLEFPRLWGLGTSSTLIYNIANWSQSNAFQLSTLTLGGSGYDIACAGVESPILYQIQDGKSVFEKASFNPAFKSQLFFIYLSKKQNSREGIKRYREKAKDNKQGARQISELSIAMITANTLTDFQKLIREHEQIVSEAIEMTKVQDLYFSDFEGVVKSLGAWGGDFILAATHWDQDRTRKYFNKKGFDVFFKYSDLVMNA